jgi:hypothetical protein
VRVVFGATFVKVYDVRSSVSCAGLWKDERFFCWGMMRYTLANEDIVIRSGAVIPLRVAAASNSSIPEDLPTSWKISLLFDTGPIQFLDRSIDCNGDFEDQEESYIECGDVFSFQTLGIRRYNGAYSEPVGSTSTIVLVRGNCLLTWNKAISYFISAYHYHW